MYRQLGKGLSLLLVLLALGWLVHHARPGLAPDPAWIDAEVRGRGVAGTFWFMTVAALFASIGLPRQVVAFLAGYAYGLWAGTGLALAAVVVACVLSFGYGRLAGRWLGFVVRNERLRHLGDFVRAHAFSGTLMFRLLPAGSNLLLNLSAGAAGVRAVPFFLASALGYLPQTLIFALAGSGVVVQPGWRIGLALVLFVLSALLGFRLYRRYRRWHTQLPVEPV